jgi:hypothetical protein
MLNSSGVTSLYKFWTIHSEQTIAKKGTTLLPTVGNTFLNMMEDILFYF